MQTLLTSIALLLFLPSLLLGAPRLFEATVAPDTVTVGDRVRLTLRVERDTDGSVVYPNVEESAPPFELLDVVDLPLDDRGESVVQGRVYVLAAYETGALGIPQLEVGLVSAAGETSIVYTDSLPVIVKTVLPEFNEGDNPVPKPIKEPIELPRRVWPYVLLAAAIAACAAGLLLLRRWWARRRAAEPEEPVEAPRVPRRAAHVVALERLRALRAEDPIGRGELAAFYLSVTDILRRYIGDRYAVEAIDMTTGEIGPAMTASGIDPSDIGWVVRFLDHADLAKFAKHEPTTARAFEDLDSAESFVERTRFRDEPEGVTEGVPEAAGEGDEETGATRGVVSDGEASDGRASDGEGDRTGGEEC